MASTDVDPNAEAAIGEQATTTPTGIRRVLQIVVGVLLVIGGIILSGPGIPGPGLITIIVGLNMIKPNNRLVRWIRRKAPGVPEDGPLPKGQIVVVLIVTVVFVMVSIFFGEAIMNWLVDSLGIPLPRQ